MSKRRAAAEVEPLPPGPPAATLAPRWKAVLSVLLALHVLAVFIAPFHFASSVGGEASPFTARIYSCLRPYIGAMFLDQGYAFFAPDPGATHSVRYRVEFDDGRPPVEGVFPDLSVHRPRLLYHRHFMLAEELFNRYAIPEPLPEPVAPSLTASSEQRARYRLDSDAYREQFRRWEIRRRAYEAMRESVEQHLLAAHGGSRVTITRLERRPPSREEVRELGLRLDDPSLIRELSETSFPGGEP